MEAKGVLFVGGHPKGHPVPFHPLTLSGKRLRALVDRFNIDAEYLDLWTCQEQENIGTIDTHIIDLIATMSRNRVVVALGKWVHRCMRRADLNAEYLPHPAARRKQDLVALSQGIRRFAKAKEDIMASPTGLLLEAAKVAERLHDKHYEDMMSEGEALDFNVVFVPGSLYVQIRIGENALWDSEDDNDGEDQAEDNMERFCEESLAGLAEMFAAACGKTLTK